MPSPFNGRTYGRKLTAKRRQSPGNEQRNGKREDPVMPRKRRRLSVEIVDGPDIVQHPSPSPVPKLGNVLKTYGSPKRSKKSPSPPDTIRSPQKAPRLTRDLSGIFESITPASSPSSSPTKLARRMLARSKTESSIDNQTSAAHFDRTPSLPNLPSSPKPSNSLSSITSDSPPISRAPVIPTATRTYAGKSRSFLVAIPTSTLSANGTLPDEDDEYSTRESYASLRTRWGIDNSEDDPYPAPLASPSRSSAASTPSGSPRKGKGKAPQDVQRTMPIPNGMMNPLKSITELRSKGESRRFLDEVGYLFEGMEATGGVGLRRASALEITTKLCDVEFARKAKAADFLARTWDVFLEAGAGRGDDKILDTLLAFFAVLVARDPLDLADLAQRTPERGKRKQTASSLVDTLFSLLNNYFSDDPLVLVSLSLKDRNTRDVELKKAGVQKKDRMLFQTVYDTIVSKSSLFPPDTPISTPFLITHTLQALPPSLIPTHHLPILLASIRTTLSPFLASSSPSPYPPWPAAAHDVHFENVYYHLRMLDMYLLGQWDGTTSKMEESGHANNPDVEDADGVQRINDLPAVAMNTARTWLASALVALGVCAEIRSGASASTITEITLRVLVSLTHGDAAWAHAVVECERANALAWVMRVVTRFEWGMGKQDQEAKVKKEVAEHTMVKDVAAKDMDEVETQALDRLCLALGLLTNLVQVVERTKDLLRETRVHPSCTLKNRPCIRQCICATLPSPSHNSKTTNNISLNALDVLVQLYVQLTPAAFVLTSTPCIPVKKEYESSPSPSPPATRSGTRCRDTADASFLRGHLAVLFGLLMRENPVNQAYILDALCSTCEGMGEGALVTSKFVIDKLVEQAMQFAAFYAVISASGRSGRMDGEVETEMDALSESKVARDVVLFLESLRS